MGSLIAQLDLALERQNQGHSDFEGLYLIKEQMTYVTIKH